jgi:hypothetical protein
MSESSSEDRKEAETPQDETPVDNVDSVDKTDATAATDHVMKHGALVKWERQNLDFF